MTRRIIVAVGLCAAVLGAQTTVNGGRVFTGILKSNGTNAAVDFSGASSTAPVQTGLVAARPASCTTGQMYFATDATAGQNLSYCSAPNTWSTASGSGSVPATVVQTNQSNAYTAGAQDFGGAGHTVPAKKGTVALLPSTCAVGEAYFATDATAGQNMYYCTATNAWTQQLIGTGGGGGGNPAGVSGSLQKNNGAGAFGGQAMIYSNFYGGGSERQAGWNCTPKMTIPYTAFTAASVLQQIRVASVPAYWFPSAILLNEATPFASGNGQVTGLAASVGTTASPSYYLLPLPLMQASPNFRADNVNGQPATLQAHDVFVQVNITNANPGALGNGTTSNLTAGSLEVAICGGTWQ